MPLALSFIDHRISVQTNTSKNVKPVYAGAVSGDSEREYVQDGKIL